MIKRKIIFNFLSTPGKKSKVNIRYHNNIQFLTYLKTWKDGNMKDTI